MSKLALGVLCAIGFAIGACAAVDNTRPPSSTIDTAIESASITYSATSIALAGYEALKPCGEPGAGKICYDANVGSVASAALKALHVAIVAAQNVRSGAPGDKVAVATEIAKAVVAVATIAAQLQF